MTWLSLLATVGVGLASFHLTVNDPERFKWFAAIAPIAYFLIGYLAGIAKVYS